jgi:hypothetical protein
MIEQSKDGQQPPFNPIQGELDDDGIIHVTCDLDHYGVILYDARRYEVLVRSAARAALDGYTNEVVAIMSSALERMYEFYIRVSCRAKGITEQSIADAWKKVAAQSERQFGAFQFLYLLDQKKPFKLDQEIIEIRNKVIHRGKIVREKESFDFSERVYSIIQHLQTTLESLFPEFVAEEANRELKDQEAKIPKGVEHLTLSIMTVNVKENEVKGKTTKFVEQVAAIHHARERGFPE